MGLELLDWLQTRTLPEEARLADEAVARETAQRFLRRLLPPTARPPRSSSARTSRPRRSPSSRRPRRAGCGSPADWSSPTATCCPSCTHAPSRPTSPAGAQRRWHGHGRLRYAVTPRSRCRADGCSRPAGGLASDRTRLLHEPPQREPGRDQGRCRAVPVVARLPRHLRALRARQRRRVFAHDVHVTDDEASRLAIGRRRWPIAPRATRSWGAACSHDAATSSTACAWRSARTSAPARGLLLRRGPGRVPGQMCTRRATCWGRPSCSTWRRAPALMRWGSATRWATCRRAEARTTSSSAARRAAPSRRPLRTARRAEATLGALFTLAREGASPRSAWPDGARLHPAAVHAPRRGADRPPA